MGHFCVSQQRLQQRVSTAALLVANPQMLCCTASLHHLSWKCRYHRNSVFSMLQWPFHVNSLQPYWNACIPFCLLNICLILLSSHVGLRHACHTVSVLGLTMRKPICWKGLATLQLPSSCMCRTFSAVMLPSYRLSCKARCCCPMSPPHLEGASRPAFPVPPCHIMHCTCQHVLESECSRAPLVLLH